MHEGSTAYATGANGRAALTLFQAQLPRASALSYLYELRLPGHSELSSLSVFFSPSEHCSLLVARRFSPHRSNGQGGLSEIITHIESVKKVS